MLLLLLLLGIATSAIIVILVIQPLFKATGCEKRSRDGQVAVNPSEISSKKIFHQNGNKRSWRVEYNIVQYNNLEIAV